MSDHAELAQISLIPEQEEAWFLNRIRPEWERLLNESHHWDGDRDQVMRLLEKLTNSFRLGADPELAARLEPIPGGVAMEWARLAYTQFTPDKRAVLDDIIRLLENPLLPLPHRLQISKNLKSLKVLVEVIPEMEEKANRIIQSLRYGNHLGRGGAGEGAAEVKRSLGLAGR